MRAVIMAGGLGTRLRPLTFSIPKPMLPVSEKPILEIILNKLRSHDIDDVVIALGYGAELIKAYFGNGEKLGIKISYVHEEKLLGTAGPLKLIKGLSEPVLVMNGDILTKLKFHEMFKYHRKNRADMTVAVKQYVDRLPFGTIEQEGGLITGIDEKPSFNYKISTGIYIINPEVIENIPSDTFFSIPDLIKSLIKKKRRVLPYEYDEYWLAIEQMDQLEEASKNIDNWSDER